MDEGVIQKMLLFGFKDLESKVGVMVHKESMRIRGTSRVIRDQTPG